MRQEVQDSKINIAEIDYFQHCLAGWLCKASAESHAKIWHQTPKMAKSNRFFEILGADLIQMS